MPLRLKNLWTAVKHSGSDIINYNITKLSAALAYFTVFSIAPMLIVVISLCSLFYGREAIQGRVYGQIKSVVGPDAAAQIQQIIGNASLSPRFTFASVIGVIILLFSATGVFVEIQSSINLIWNLKTKAQKAKRGLLKMLQSRLLSFSLIISLGFIALVSLVINTVVDALATRLLRILPEVTIYVGYIINVAITLLAITLLFAIIFKFLPDARIKWKDVWTGAFATAILFILGKFGIGLYLNKSNLGSAYGAAGSVIIILTWVYYSAIILYFGAAFTKNYAQAIGRRIYPNQYAVYIQQVEIESKEALTDLESKKVQECEDVPDRKTEL
jgi:membrane protein